MFISMSTSQTFNYNNNLKIISVLFVYNGHKYLKQGKTIQTFSHINI